MTIEEYKKQQIEKYNREHPQTLNYNERIERLSENTNCIVVNMTIEEYLKKTGYKTYSEIKKELGL